MEEVGGEEEEKQKQKQKKDIMGKHNNDSV
jgi:hypothetical protein